MSVDGNFNVNNIIVANIRESVYYKDRVRFMSEFGELLDELVAEVKHVDPFSAGHQRLPSTAFCLMYQLMTVRPTNRQVNALMAHANPFVRAVGFLLVRYTCPGANMWSWLSPFLDDDTRFKPSILEGSPEVTVGQYVEQLLTQQDYLGTRLPRIPVPIQRKISRLLLERNEPHLAAKGSEKNRDKIKVGLVCRARYAQDKLFYRARVDEVLKNGNFLVTFIEYGNQEEVSLADIKLRKTKSKAGSGRSRSRSRSRSRGKHRSRRSRTHSPDDDAIREEILRRERESAATSGRNFVRSRIGSHKSMMSMPLQVGTNRKRERSPTPPRRYETVERSRRSRSRSRSKSPLAKAQPSAEHLAKMAKLRAKYGDASVKKDS